MTFLPTSPPRGVPSHYSSSCKSKDAAVDFGMQGLYAPVEHFRKTGQFRDVLHLNAGVAQQLRGAAGGDEFHSLSREGASEIYQSGLVGNAYDVISRLRPTFLKGRGQSSSKGETETLWPSVYLDGVFYGDISSLRTIDSFQIAEARLYQAWEAQTKFGMNNASGVIDITTRRQ